MKYIHKSHPTGRNFGWICLCKSFQLQRFSSENFATQIFGSAAFTDWGYYGNSNWATDEFTSQLSVEK
jgi:hypothetical protein